MMARRPSMTAAATAAPLRPLAAAGDGRRAVARAGKKAFACWADPVLAKRFRRVMLELDVTVQQAMIDAITDYVEKHAEKIAA